ncbi:FecR family protein [Cohaesibacter sp. ES.047]|uniref:FecR family protein n=1 Tax=Cohaesibacter sp. ES.047 TaxID=1798205 RepID=UPI0015616F5F|nr:FecR family protein [Cohaesibacter sp. ES.047]
MRTFIAAMLASFLLVLSIPAEAGSSDVTKDHVWRLGKVSGEAWIETRNREPMRVYKNRMLFPGQTLTTGSRTRLLLTRGKERIQIGSNTSMSLPDFDDLLPGRTIINQARGTLHLQVDKKNVKHFAVQTPYMVAAVKGTKFTIDIKDQDTSVRVHEGVVEVTNRQTNRTMDVNAGETVALDIKAWKIPAANDQMRPKRNDARMVLIERGGDDPATVAERARLRAEERHNGDLVSIVLAYLGSIIVAVANLVAVSFDSVVRSVTGFVVSAAEPAMGAVHDVASVNNWVRILIAALAALIAIMSVSIYVVFRKRKARRPIPRRVV